MKEQIYDEQISPLMAQIIAICKEHKIAMLANFRIPNDEDPDLVCTTALLGNDHEPSQEQIDAYRKLMNSANPITFINVKDKDGNLKSSTAILE